MSLLRGRDGVLRSTFDVLERASRTGQSSLIALEGEAGIGKTAILSALVARSRELGYTAGTGKAEEADLAPMGPVMQALRSGTAPILTRKAFGELAPLLQQPLLLVERLTEFIEDHTANGPVLIAIDDVQWLDDLSAYALRAMPGRLAGSPVVWIVSSRTAIGGRLDDIGVSAGRDIPVERVLLGPLEQDAIAELARDQLGNAPDQRLRDLLDGANGNPFLAVELLSGISTENVTLNELPSRLLNAVGSRLSSLPAETLRLVQAGAVIGIPFTVADVATLMNASPESVLSALDAAVRSGVLLDNGNHLSFKHDLLRAAVYQDVRPTLRKAMHRAAAQRALASGADAVTAARHITIIAVPGEHESVRILREAAQQLVSTTPVAAGDFIMRALALLTPSDPLWFEIGELAVSILTAGSRSRDSLSIADELLAANPTNETAARVQLLIVDRLRALGRYTEMTERVDAISFDYVTPVLRSRLLAYRAISLAREIDPARAITAGTYARNESRRVEDPQAEALSLFALLETARNDGRNNDALRYAEDMRAVTGRISGDEILALQAVDRFDDSGRLWGVAFADINDRHPNVTREFELSFSALTRHYLGGSFDEAKTAGLAAVRLGEELQEQRIQYEAHLFLNLIAYLQDDREAAAYHDRASVAGLTESDYHRAAISHIARGFLATFSGAYDESLVHFRHIYGPGEMFRHRWRWQPQALMAAARAGFYGGDMTFARDVAEQAALLAERNPNVPTIVGVAKHILGLVSDDDSALEDAADILRKSPRDFSRGDAARERGRIHLAKGRRTDGIAALDEAWERFTRVGAWLLASGAQHDLQAAGVRRKGWTRTAKRPTEGWNALTKTEQRVARLIADGRTNREAAAELVISLNTIATHVRSIFGKLGVASRVQLTRIVLESG